MPKVQLVLLKIVTYAIFTPNPSIISIWLSSGTSLNLLQREAENGRQKQILGLHGSWKIKAHTIKITRVVIMPLGI